MSIDATITDAIKDAMKSKDQARLRTLRSIKAALLVAKTAEGAHGQISEADEMKLIQKLYKQRLDSYEIYVQQKRDDLALIEKEEMDIIEAFLPKQFSDDELIAAVKEIISAAGATSMKDMGKVMGMASGKLSGKADGKRIADTVKQLLSQ